jgi:hypothetical protein
MVSPTSLQTSAPTTDTNLNAFLKTREQLEASHPIDNHDFLYPDLNDPDFTLFIQKLRVLPIDIHVVRSLAELDFKSDPADEISANP